MKPANDPLKERTAELKGTIHLLAKGGRNMPLIHGYWGHCNVSGQQRQDSYALFLPQESLNPGESSPAGLCFKFSSHPNFELRLEAGNVLELNEGARKIGEFHISEILNDKLRL